MTVEEARKQVRTLTGNNPKDADIDVALRKAGLALYVTPVDAKGRKLPDPAPHNKYVAWTPGTTYPDIINIPDKTADAVIHAAADALRKNDVPQNKTKKTEIKE